MKQRKPLRAAATAPIFHAPMRMEWSDEKLERLDQDQLLNLLTNLDHQRTIGRLGPETAEPLEARITALLSGRHLTRRRKALAALATEATGEELGAEGAGSTDTAN